MFFLYPFVTHDAHAKNIAVYADQSISPALFPLLADVEQRLQKSSLDDPRLQHRVLIRDNTRLFAFFSNTDSRTRGVNKACFNQYIFLRRAEIQRNRLIGPPGIEVPGERTLVYFIDYATRDRGFVFGECSTRSTSRPRRCG